MSRRRAAEKRVVLPDAKYGDVVGEQEAIGYLASVAAGGAG